VTSDVPTRSNAPFPLHFFLPLPPLDEVLDAATRLNIAGRRRRLAKEEEEQQQQQQRQQQPQPQRAKTSTTMFCQGEAFVQIHIEDEGDEDEVLDAVVEDTVVDVLAARVEGNEWWTVGLLCCWVVGIVGMLEWLECLTTLTT
jgi:hypothetical protein